MSAAAVLGSWPAIDDLVDSPEPLTWAIPWLGLQPTWLTHFREQIGIPAPPCGVEFSTRATATRRYDVSSRPLNLARAIAAMVR